MIWGVFSTWSSAKLNPKFSCSFVFGLDDVAAMPELGEKAAAPVARATVRREEREGMVAFGVGGWLRLLSANDGERWKMDGGAAGGRAGAHKQASGIVDDDGA